jgi:cell division septum initiation protein DivIVA
MNTMGGTVGLRGSYDTKDHAKPKVDFAYDLKEIDINELATNFVTVGKLAPIAKFAKGKISSNLQMKSFLTPNLDPIYSSLTGLGDFSTSSLNISGFKPLEKMSEALNIKKLSNQTVKDVKAKFSFSDGKVTVKPFDVNLGKIKSTISGTTSFEQAINYDIKMMIPKEEIPASMVKTAEQALSKLNALAPKLDVKTIPAVIPVKVGMGGTVTDPKITTNFKEALLEATGNLKDNLVNNIKETVKDSVKAIVTQKVDEIKEDLNAKKQQIMDDAQKQADKIKADAAKANAKAKAEADKAYDQLVAEAGSNPLKKKAAEVAGKKAKDEAYKKADQAQDEANKKADGIMANAKQKADQLK